MLVTNHLKRVFLFETEGEKIKLSDPDSKMSPETVLNYYSNTYPLLTTAKIDGPTITGDAIQFEFITTLGTKG